MKKINTDTIKGFRDYVGEEAQKREKILAIIKRAFERYGFEPAETPIIESEAFVRGDNAHDEAVRDVYTLKDRGERALALRYEFTFQLARLAQKQKLPYKRYQIGYNFRDEPIREGRLRQFIQADADTIGSTNKDEAENFRLITEVFEELNIPITIYVNNKKLINEILVDLDIKEKNREAVIRTIDKLDKMPKAQVAEELKGYDAEKILEVLCASEDTFEKYGAYQEIKQLRNLCKLFDVDVVFRPFLARGFSYYNGTVFEVWSDKLKVSIMGGGSYRVKDIQATGISFGLEPISLLTTLTGDTTEYLIASLDEDAKAVQVAQQLRDAGKTVLLLFDKTPTKALEYAHAKKIQKVIIIGEEEVKQNSYLIKDMVSGKTSPFTLK